MNNSEQPAYPINGGLIEKCGNQWAYEVANDSVKMADAILKQLENQPK